MKNHYKKQKIHVSIFLFSITLVVMLCFVSCSFDYGTEEGTDEDQPDITMDNVDYVRVRSADTQARFQAERAERYEKRRIMLLSNFAFEQFGNHGEEVNAYGRAGTAMVEIDSGDIKLDQGVRIDIDSEDIAIETNWLEWKDKPRTLSSGKENEVNIYQGNGTYFTGIGLYADARRRSWEFSGNVSGTYVYEENDEEENSEDGEIIE
jgi:LPS export ABC transporter protein LptC